MEVKKLNMRTPINQSSEPRRLRRLIEGGACVVVVARESHAHVEGGQGTERVVNSMDLDDWVDEGWLLSVQRKVHQWSRAHLSYHNFGNWNTDIRNLRCAWRKITLTKGDGLQQSTG
jgi:hypothetical protein